MYGLSTCSSINDRTHIPVVQTDLHERHNGSRRIYLICHFNHPNELTPQSLEALRLVQEAGVICVNQCPLIKGVNDRPEHAVQLADYLQGLTAKLNLIPYNPRRRSPFDAPTEQDVETFRQRLIDQRVFVRLRRSKGHQIRAACGQLGGVAQGPQSTP